MGYYTEIEGKIYYGDTSPEKQEIIEKIVSVLDFMQWGCAARYSQGTSIDYYDGTNEWIHFIDVNIDLENKTIDLSGDRKDYDNATLTFLHYIAPYLNPNAEHKITGQGEEEDDVWDATVKQGKVFVAGEEFETENEISFPLPRFSKRY